jgi:hypothetical protein
MQTLARQGVCRFGLRGFAVGSAASAASTPPFRGRMCRVLSVNRTGNAWLAAQPMEKQVAMNIARWKTKNRGKLMPAYF